MRNTKYEDDVLNGMRKKIYISIFFILVIAGVTVFFAYKKVQAPETNLQLIIDNSQREIKNNQQELQIQQPEQKQQLQPQTVNPIKNALSRITKKPFGVLITKQNSPVQPERFAGYHTAVDLETTHDEQNIDVPLKALCAGKLLIAKNANGYGGVAVQSCVLDGQAVTIIYGHIRLSSITVKVGAELKAGDFLANLGTGFSSETDGERRHLHLGIHKGRQLIFWDMSS